MLRVAKVAALVCDHWKGPAIDKNLILKMALVHDLGNIVVIDKNNLKLKEKYGKNDHRATSAMLREINFPEDFILALESKNFGSSPQLVKSNDWNLKIVFYGDLRTQPTGITSLKERLDEYLKRVDDYYKKLNIQELISACFEIEKQIQQNLDVPVSEINDQNVIVNKSLLNDFEI